MSAARKKQKRRVVVAEPWRYERVDGDPTLRQIADVLDALGMRAEVTIVPKETKATPKRESWWQRLFRR